MWSACGVDCCLHTGFLLSPKFLESPTQLRWSTLHKCQRNVFQSEVRKKMCKANTFYGWAMGTVSRSYRKHFCPFDFCRSLFLARLLFKWSRYLKVHTSKCCMCRRLCFLHIYVLHTSLTYYHYLLKLFMMNRQTFMLLGLIFLIFKCLLFVNVLDPLFSASTQLYKATAHSENSNCFIALSVLPSKSIHFSCQASL